MSLLDPRVQRVRRSDSFSSVAPAPPPKDSFPSSSIGIKRAPSYGALVQGAKQEYTVNHEGLTHVRKLSGSYPSSDEEEKIRTTRAKKMKIKKSAVDSVVPTTLHVDSPPPSSTPSSPRGSDTMPSTPAAKAPALPAKDRVSPKAKPMNVAAGREERSKTPKSPTLSNRPTNGTNIGKAKDKKEPKPLAMNLQRNPSMLGPELPHLRKTAKHISTSPVYGGTVTPKMRSPSPAVLATPPPVITAIQVLDVHQSPTPPKIKTLRRVRRLAPARRISFGSLTPGDEADGEGEAGGDRCGLSGCLGSAFQLI